MLRSCGYSLCAVVAAHLGAPTGRQIGCLRNRRWAFSTSAESTRGCGLQLLPRPLLRAPAANGRRVPSLQPNNFHHVMRHTLPKEQPFSYTAFCFYISGCRFGRELFGSSSHDLSRKINLKLFARTLNRSKEDNTHQDMSPSVLKTFSNCTRRKPKSFELEYVDMLLFDLRPDLQHN